MSRNKDVVADAFTAWQDGTGYVSSIFADTMTWEIAGRSAASGKYASTREFVDQVLHPFAERFSDQEPFRPVRIRSMYEDEAASTVVVVWDGEGRTVAGTVYTNTYAWIMTLAGGKVVDGTAFYDSIAFNELWDTVPPASG